MSTNPEREFTEELREPPRLSPTDVLDGVEPRSDAEISDLIELTSEMPGLQAAFNRAEENFTDEQFREVQEYAVRKIPPVYENFHRETILGTALDADASPADSGLSRRIQQRVAGAGSVSAAKREVDATIRDRFGISRAGGPVIGAINNTLEESDVPFSIPNPRLRFGDAEVASEFGRDETIDITGTSRLNITPVTKEGEPILSAGQPSGIVAGPRAQTTEPTTVEMVYRAEEGQAATVTHVLFRFLVVLTRTVGTKCAMATAAFYERIWVPILVHNDKVQGTVRQPIRFEPDRDKLLAVRFQPLGKNLSDVTIRTIQ